jgi:hypothetical protein
LPAFPAGVPDLATWGDTVIEFGQYKNQHLSYFDLVTATDERSTGYLKWCRSRSNSSSGQLKDLCDYLAHHFAEIKNDLRPWTLDPGHQHQPSLEEMRHQQLWSFARPLGSLRCSNHSAYH